MIKIPITVVIITLDDGEHCDIHCPLLLMSGNGSMAEPERFYCQLEPWERLRSPRRINNVEAPIRCGKCREATGEVAAR